MRYPRTAALLGLALLMLALGPVVLLLGLLALAVPRVRAWLRPDRRAVVGWAGAVVVAAPLLVAVPGGWLPIVAGPGTEVTPAYVGRPALGDPAGPAPAPVPHVAPALFAGPLGESPRVRSRWYGLAGCQDLAVDTHHRLVTLCGGPGRPVLRLLDPGSLRQLASKDLPGRAGLACPGVFFADDAGHVVVATTDQQLLTVGTADAQGDSELTTTASVDLSGALPDDDCVTGLRPDPQGHVWFASHDGRVGIVADGRPRTVDVGDELDRPLVTSTSSAYVAGGDGLHKVAVLGGRPVAVWSTPYDGADPGAAPVVLPSGAVAVATDRDPRLEVTVLRSDTGAVVCRTPLFGDGSSTDGGLVATGDGRDAVLVTNGQGYGGPLTTVLGRTTTGGIARVDVRDGRCVHTWTSDLDAPSGAPAVSPPVGLAYAVTKRHSWWGVDAWYVTALDLRTGRAVWARRVGLGVLRDNHHAAPALGPDGSLYVPVLGGFLRVHDRS
jgi:hypothetical protein